MRWLVLLASLAVVLLASSVGVTAGSFIDLESSSGNTFGSWTSTLWNQTTQSDFQAGVLNNTNTSSSPGHVKLAATGGHDQIYTFRGSSTNFYRYDITDEVWSPPFTIGSGGSLTYDGSNYIYAFRGGSASDFWRYDVANGLWKSLANAPANVAAGGALACGGSQYVYAFRGGGNTAFWKYDITANSWTAMANAPATVGTGGALVFNGSNYVYAFRGNSNAAFWRYDIAANSWTAMANAPATVAAGGALTYDGSNYIYAFQGGTNAAFWRYNVAANSWAAMANAPATVAGGGALAYDGSSYVYAFRGNSTGDFWRYDVADNLWTLMGSAPASISLGGALALVSRVTYMNWGTVASQVVDTRVAAARWNALFWDKTLQTSTNITFEVRASDTSFAQDTPPETLPWTSVGGTSPVTSGLPSGRYKQWWVTLTTSDTFKTPALHEVRVYYY